MLPGGPSMTRYWREAAEDCCCTGRVNGCFAAGLLQLGLPHASINVHLQDVVV